MELSARGLSLWVLCLSLLLAGSPPARAEEKPGKAKEKSLKGTTFVYVSMAPEEKIQVYRLEPDGGKLTRVEAIKVKGAPGALAVDPKKKFLLASLRTTSTLASFRIDPSTGKLKLLSTVDLPKGENAA